MAKSERGWLKQFSGMITRQLEDVALDTGAILTPIPQIATYPTNSDGWYADIARVPTGRGDRLQVWVDAYSRADGRRVYLCYKTSQPSRADAIAQVGVQGLGPALRVDDSFYRRCAPDRYEMKAPLAAAMYGKPIAEMYSKGNSWSFYGTYFADAIDPLRPPSDGLVTRASIFLAAVLRSAADWGVTSSEAYREAKRVQVRKHLTRERAAKLANLAKVRDEFTCQVCSINFARLYGEVGRGFAEAHHRIPLASPKAKARTRVEDLVTVCANCHRMLHRLSPAKDGVPELRKRFTGKWPTSGKRMA